MNSREAIQMAQAQDDKRGVFMHDLNPWLRALVLLLDERLPFPNLVEPIMERQSVIIQRILGKIQTLKDLSPKFFATADGGRWELLGDPKEFFGAIVTLFDELQKETK